MSPSQSVLPYKHSELKNLYPDNLELALVQVILRHGERVPTSARFQNIGLSQYWPYCSAARRLRSIALIGESGSEWDSLQWRRRLETFNDVDDRPVLAAGPSGDVDNICQPGELTDKGRQSTFDLGQRLRHLYVHQLGFMPELISNANMFYIRASEVPRAIESAQQTWWGMYPNTARTVAFPPPTIVTRSINEETIYPNHFRCRRFKQMFDAFAKRTADRWNGSEEMKFLNEKLSKYMPPSSPKVAVNGSPTLTDIMDTIHSTEAHGPDVRLPQVFYDPDVLDVIDKIECENWYSGYDVNRELRTLGVGAFAGDIIDRMITKVGENISNTSVQQHPKLSTHRVGVKFALYGCHDISLAAFLASFGAFENQGWPPYTSHIAIELFRTKSQQQSRPRVTMLPSATSTDASDEKSVRSSVMLGLDAGSETGGYSAAAEGLELDSSDMIRRHWSTFSDVEKRKLDGYYVRLRYNNQVMRIPACGVTGRHLEGNDTFCTLEAFKRIADEFLPINWKDQCLENLDSPIAGLEKGTEQRPGME